MKAKSNERRRVLFLVGQLGFGGSEGQLRLLLEHLDLTRWQPHVLVFHASPNADYVSRLREINVGVSNMLETAGGPLGKIAFTASVARSVRPDVIHSWTVHDNPYAAWAGRLAGVKVRWGSLRGSTTLPGFLSLPRWYRRCALRSVQRIVVNSQSLVNELVNLGLKKDRVLLLPNCVEVIEPVNDDARSGCFEGLGFTSAHRVFGNVGNIRRVKNQILFVRALARVIEEHPEARGVIIGETLDGEDEIRIEIESEVNRHGLDGKIILLGFRADTRRLLGGLTALCTTSDSEGMPNVVLEAMATGVPVVATAVGGVPEVLTDGETGFLVSAGDESGVVDAMCRVLEAPDQAFRIAETARRIVTDERSCVAMARQLEAAYGAALGEAAWS